MEKKIPVFIDNCVNEVLKIFQISVVRFAVDYDWKTEIIMKIIPKYYKKKLYYLLTSFYP